MDQPNPHANQSVLPASKTQSPDKFSFDGQIHIPPERVEATLETAINAGLDAVFFTNYGNTQNFDYLSQNYAVSGRPILEPQDWDIQAVSPVVLKISNQTGGIYVLKSQEAKTKQGHVLLWGVKEPIENGRYLHDVLRKTYAQKAVPVFSHLLVGIFHGCGIRVFDEAYDSFKGYPLGVEKNGQIAASWDVIFGPNRKVEQLAKERGIACLGTSDIHGAYLSEHKKVGSLYYSSVPASYVDPAHLAESLGEILLEHPESVTVGGRANSLLSTVLWNLASLRKNGMGKVKDVCDGIVHKIRQ